MSEPSGSRNAPSATQSLAPPSTPRFSPRPSPSGSGPPMPGKHSGYINTDGVLVLPPGVEMPKTVPYELGK